MNFINQLSDVIIASFSSNLKKLFKLFHCDLGSIFRFNPFNK